MDRFEEVSSVGSIEFGPTLVTRSQPENPGSVEAPATWGSRRSAPFDGARVSGTHGPELAGRVCEGSACGWKVET
jgi:hypothetical protein